MKNNNRNKIKKILQFLKMYLKYNKVKNNKNEIEIMFALLKIFKKHNKKKSKLINCIENVAVQLPNVSVSWS